MADPIPMPTGAHVLVGTPGAPPRIIATPGPQGVPVVPMFGPPGRDGDVTMAALEPPITLTVLLNNALT